VIELFVMRKSSYCFQRVLAIAILSFCLSVVRHTITRVDQSETVQARITKSSPSAAWNTLVSGTVKLFHKFEGGGHLYVGQQKRYVYTRKIFVIFYPFAEKPPMDEFAGNKGTNTTMHY